MAMVYGARMPIDSTDRLPKDNQSKTLKKLIISWALFIFGCGIGLLWLSFNSLTDFFYLLALGIIAIIAAVTYTMGKTPMGTMRKAK